MKAYIVPVLIVLTVLFFTSGSAYSDPVPLGFDEALEKVRNGEVVKELNLRKSMLDSSNNSCISPEKYQYLIEFKDLEQLVIGNCGIKMVPPEIFELKDLKNLKTLSLRSNELEEIPEGISALQQLEYLNLSNNELRKIPEGIGKLSNLKELLLQGNPIGTLPESIGQLMNLEELDLKFNRMITFPSSMVNLVNLKKINNVHGSLDFGLTKEKFSYKELWEQPHYLKVLRHNPPQIIPEAYTVTATSGLSVRNKPKLKAKKIGAMPHKLKIAVYEESKNTETIDGITAPWMRIKAVANGKYMEGWAWGGYLKKYKYEEDYPFVFQVMVNNTKPEISNFTLDTKQIQFLVKNGADINTQSAGPYRGLTLLYVVGGNGNIKDFRFLLANGADPEITDGWYSVGRAVVERNDIGFESKKAFLLVLKDYGYDFKSKEKELLKSAIYSFFHCGVMIEEIEEQDSELLDFLKEELNIKHVSEVLNDDEVRTICFYRGEY